MIDKNNSEFYEKRYANSQKFLTRALKSIPLGAQTFSKSRTQFPNGVSPYFIQKGKGSKVWDVDGNEYVDFINALCAITLGYADPDVDQAVKDQLSEGVIFSLSHPIEAKTAEKIIELVPCAEKVRFGKNGSDATAGAIRLARAYTNRDRVAVCGYHGWQDWYIGTTARNRGVPKKVQELTHVFQYNNIDSLQLLMKTYPDEFAAVILEPMNTTEPKNNFLEEVQELTKKNGAVLIFDETITGFRFANGGAQEFFKIKPDLATFGKGISNGYPVSAITGKAEIMQLMEEIFFSFTFGGETLSLAAALATMTKLQKMNVISQMYTQGRKIIDTTNKLIQKHQLTEYLSMSGNPTWSFINFRDTAKYSLWDVKTLFMQEALAKGILSYGTHNLSYSHSDDDLLKLENAYDEIFYIINESIQKNNLEKRLHCKTLVPLFKVR